MKKQRIVIASVLKPLNDTRMYEKMGATLARENRYDVFIIGYPVKSIPAHSNIHFMPLKAFPRMSWERVMAPLSVLAKCIKVKPDILLVNTHELLTVAILYRILFGSKIIYDVRENYYRNILYTKVYAPGIRQVLAVLVRFQEIALSPLFNHFILAEKSYQQELGFLKDRFTLLENKSLPQGVKPLPSYQTGIDLLFSGTIDISTGIFDAIALAKALYRASPDVRLRVVGYCALKNMRKKIQDECRDCDFISLIGFDHLVPHERIMEEIRTAHFGIIHYPGSPHTQHLKPTKLYEYMACQLPILTWADQHFAEDVVGRKAGLVVTSSAGLLLDKMKTTRFYPGPLEDIFWEDKKFLHLMQTLAGKQ